MNKEYIIEMSIQLLVKDVDDVDEAIDYAEDFILGLNELAYSSDKDDDHYGIERAQIVSVRERGFAPAGDGSKYRKTK